MQLAPDGTVIVSATDLVGFLACDHLTSLELGRIEGRWERPPEREDPEVVLLQERGEAHERAYLERLRAAGRSVHEIALRHPRTPDELRAAEAETVVAMRRGVDVVYQATLFDGRWRGHADFLLRVDGPSDLGAWHYEVADTKLARSVKGSALIQVCVYSERLTTLQGRAPAEVHVVTGDGTTHPHRLDDFAAFYRTVKRRFEERLFGDGQGDGAATYPDPVDHCRVCAWFPVCIERRRADDHPSLVAGMTRAATERLIAARVPTLAALGELPPGRPVADLNQRTLDRLREQARMQLSGRRSGELLYELIEPIEGEPGRGLALLPEPSPLDLFFDIEADPWAFDDGLEYLLGVVAVDSGEPAYLPIWGHDRAEEKAAFERFVDLVIGRLERDPAMHVYHYAGYEAGAIKRLMQRHATREEEVDRILRGGVLVDLYTVVRQGVRASVESYSIKRIEKFYLPQREGPITEAGFSVVEYERWLRDRDRTHLDDLAAYNRDDCVSTWLLRDWLEERRLEAVARGWPMDRPARLDGLPSEALSAQQEETRRRVEALTAGVPADRTNATHDQRTRWLLAQLLDWHRRDARPEWWNYYRLQKLGVAELIEDGEGLGGLDFETDVEPRGRGGWVRRYRFPPQDHKIKVGSSPADPADGDQGKDAGEVVALDDVGGTIDLFRTKSKLDRHPAALIPGTPLSTNAQRDALRRVADAVLADGLDGLGPYRAARDLLLRARPRLARDGEPAAEGVSLVRPGESVVDAARRLGLELDRGVLPVQGPPGTGKTFTGGRMIAQLLKEGRRVGITAQSHKAITNLLEKTYEACVEAGVGFAAIQRCDRAEDAAQLTGVRLAGEPDDVARALASGEFRLGAGTSWLWSRTELDGLLDVLFVDEAGQLSLANAVAMATAARSLVLLGDPNQLPQVSAGVHPEGAGASALEHLVGSSITIPPDRGLFLPTTFRLHPSINGYISETFYERRLEPDASTARQRLDGRAPFGGTGIRWLPVLHVGDDSSSVDEAEAVADAIESLIGRHWTDRHGVTRPITIGDIVVVAPYNAHVAAIEGAVERRIGVRARVGTVDRFQGQEAPIAIYSMAASSADDAPRGMDFLYDWHRLNVAVSRAKGLALVVASPDLLRVKPRHVEQLREANALCRLVEVAAGDGASMGPRKVAAAPSAPGPGRSGPGPDLTLWPELDR